MKSFGLSRNKNFKSLKKTSVFRKNERRMRNLQECFYSFQIFSEVISLRLALPHMVMVDLSSPTILSI